MSNKKINFLYNYAKNNGAIGGKLIGAGGGGFLIFYTNYPDLLNAKLKQKKLQNVVFYFEFEGSKILVS